MLFWNGFWWILPLVGLAIMVMMVLACLRMMGGRSGFCCMGGHSDPRAREARNSSSARGGTPLVHELDRAGPVEHT